MNDKTAVVTGATGGIGSALAEALAFQDCRVILACRNTQKGEALRERLVRQTGNPRIETSPLDLGSFASVVRFASEIKSAGPVGLLINNAGIMCKRFCLTADGFETSIGVNYLGAVLLTRLLLPGMPPGSHIVNTVSITRKLGHIDDTLFRADHTGFGRFKAYGNAKLALTLFTATLAEQVKERGILVNGADPGIVNTEMITQQRWFDPLADLFFRPFIKSPRQGAEPALAAAGTTRSGHLFSEKKHTPMPRTIGAHPRREWLRCETERIFSEKGIDLPALD